MTVWRKPAPFPALARFSGTGLVFGMAMKIFRGRWRCPALIAVRAPMWEALAGRRVSGDAGGKVGGWGDFCRVRGRWRCPALIAVRALMWEPLAGRCVLGEAGGAAGDGGISALVMGDRPGGGWAASERRQSLQTQKLPRSKRNQRQFSLPASAALAACGHLRPGKFPWP